MRFISLFLVFLLLISTAAAESLSLEEMLSAQDAAMMEDSDHDLIMPESAAPAPQSGEESPPAVPSSPAREDLISRILATAQELHDKAGGRAQRAQYSGDIYICKNFSVHLFRENCGDFRMAQYPGVPLVIPNNQKKADCAPYVYGVEWQDVPADEGNPFYAAASFRYDEGLSKEENQ